MLLQRFTVYIDRDDEEAFVDIFDPDSECSGAGAVETGLRRARLSLLG